MFQLEIGIQPFLLKFLYLNQYLERYYLKCEIKCLLFLSQVTGDDGVKGLFKITYKSGVTFSCTYSCSIDSPSTFYYKLEGENPNYYSIQPDKPYIRMFGETSIVAFSIVRPLKYHIDVTNNTQETAYIRAISVGNWNPALPSKVSMLETGSGTV